uniref:Uncharacterized protein n=1 Tax=Arcella intermedia TaxID=1963864 RepID=A0A6B2KXP7_9EUKA
MKRKKIDDDSDDSFGDEDMKFTFSDDDEDGDVLADIGEDGQPVIRKRDNAADLENLIQSCESKAKRMKLLIINSNFKDQVLKYTNSDIKLDEDTSTTDNTPKVFAFEPKPDVMAPHCRLTGYQLVGMNWLYLLHQENLNGILADEMGLGKTLQTIALITLLKEKGLYTSPSLIVVPASALAQWGNEIKKWSPTLKYEIYNGSVGERQVLQERFLRKSTDEGRVNPYDYDILLTTYQLIGGKGDRSFLKKIFFHYVVLDEAHNIKNQKSQRFQILFRLVSKRRLLLTGTPLQNNLEELWTLLTFLMPKEFTAMKLQNYKQVFAEFIKNDKKKRQKLSDKNLYIRRIKTILGPFILRRLKAHASLEIPEKITHIEICEMGEAQRSLYNRVFQKSKNIWANHKDFQSNKKSKQANLTIDEEILDLQSDLNLPDPKGNGGVIKMQTLINNILMQLRKTCNHPILQRTFYSEEDLEKVADVLLEIDPEYENERIEQVMKELKGLSDWEIHKICLKWPEDLGELQLTDEEMWESSTKLVVLRDLLGRFYKNNNRILIFSQMTKVLDFLEPFLDSLGYRYLRLDGSTEVGARQGLIDEFNTNVDIFVFLLSTTAGGVGINLTAADTVVFYDMAFNPQVDRQAEDRCHRLGQTKQVHVYRLICKESCEEAIFAMAQEKKQLNDIVLQEGDYQSNPSQSENLSKFLGDLFIQTSKKKTRKVSSSKAKAPTKTKKKETPQDSKKSSSKKASTKTAPSKPSKSKSTPSSTTPPTKKRSSSSTAPSKEKATKPKARPKSKEIVEVTPKTRKSTPRRKAKPEVEPTETNVVPTPKLTFKLKGTPPPSTDTDPKSAPPPKPLTLKIPKIMNTENLDQMDK